MGSSRVVVIGGGVAGTSIAYHLVQRGHPDVLLLERDELTSGSTFHSAGLVGQLRSSVTLTRMMMHSTDLYRRLADGDGRRSGMARGGIAAARVLARAPAGAGAARGMGPDLRAAAADRLHGGGARALAAVRSERDPRRRVAPDRRPDRSEQPRDGDGGGRAPRWRRDPIARPRDRHRRRTRPRPRRHDRARRPDRRGRRRERRRHLRHADRAPGGRRGRGRALRAPVRPDGADRRRPGRPADDARPRPPRVLPSRGGRRARHGRLRTRPRPLDGPGRPPRRLQPPPPGRGLGPVRVDRRERAVPGAGAPRRRHRPDDQRARGVLARRRVPPGTDRGGRLLRGGGVRRTRDRRRRRHRHGAGRLDRGRRAGVGPLEDGRPPARPAVPVAPVRDRTRLRDLRDELRHPLSGGGTHGRPAAEDAADLRPPGVPRRRVRREVGLGARELVRVERRPRPRGPAAVRLGGRTLVDGDRDRAPGRPRTRRAVRRVELREDRGHRPGRGALPPAGIRERRGARARIRRLHADAERARRHRVRPDRHAPGGGPVPAGDRDGVGRARPRMAPEQPPGCARRDPRRHVLPRLPRRVGAGVARDPRSPQHRRPLERRLPVHGRAPDRRGGRPLPRTARHLRRRARLGALSGHGVRGAAVRRAARGGRAARPDPRRLPCDRLAPHREGVSSVGHGHHARGRSLRGRAWGSRSARAAASSARRRSMRRVDRSACCRASSWRTRA